MYFSYKNSDQVWSQYDHPLKGPLLHYDVFLLTSCVTNCDLYCVMLKSICTVWINDSSCVFARWRHSVMKFLNKKLMTVLSIIILQKFTNFHAIRSWSFQNICNEIWWPRFLRHPIHWLHSLFQRFFNSHISSSRGVQSFTHSWFESA